MKIINHYRSKSITIVTVKRARSYHSRPFFNALGTLRLLSPILAAHLLCLLLHCLSELSLIFVNTVWRSDIILFVSEPDTEAWGSEAQGLA